jgi:hypothetical protein
MSNSNNGKRLSDLYIERESIKNMISKLNRHLDLINIDIEIVKNTSINQLNDGFYCKDGYRIGFVFMTDFKEVDRFVIDKIECNDGWVVIIDNYGESYSICIDTSNVYVRDNKLGHTIIHKDLLKTGKFFYISLKTDGTFRRKLRQYEIDLINLYCRRQKFDIDSLRYHEFKRYLNNYQTRY